MEIIKLHRDKKSKQKRALSFFMNFKHRNHEYIIKPGFGIDFLSVFGTISVFFQHFHKEVMHVHEVRYGRHAPVTSKTQD